MAQKPHIRHLKEDRDIAGLIHALRFPEDADIRERAARALGDLNELNTVESLIRSHLQDPDVAVRQASFDALHSILGSEAETAIAAYVLPEDDWIVEEPAGSEPSQVESDALMEGGDLEEPEDDDLDKDNEEYEEDEDEPGTIPDEPNGGNVRWDANDIHGLMAIIRLDHSRKKRLKSIQALSQIEDTRAIDALASIALWSEEKWLRQAAREALANVYGEDLEAVLQSYREASSEMENPKADGEDDDDQDEDEEDAFGEDEDDEDEDDEDDDVEDEDDDVEEAEGDEALSRPAIRPENKNRSTDFGSQPIPTIREDKTSWVTYLLLGLLFLVVLAGVVLLLNR